MWKWKFNLIFISTQLSEMHRTVRVNARTESIFSNIPSAEIFLVFTHFMPLVSFYTTMKILENQRFSDVFRRYRKRPLSWNRLMLSHLIVSESFLKSDFISLESGILISVRSWNIVIRISCFFLSYLKLH